MIRRYIVLYNTATAGNGVWIECDSRYETHPTRVIHGTVNAGDIIAIQAITKDVKGTEQAFLTTLDPADITTLITYTADFNDVINGPWSWIRIVKTGTAGTSKVSGMI